MPVTEASDRCLRLQSGSTSVRLDKDAGKAVLQRKFLFWKLKPLESPLANISDVRVDVAVDPASGAEIHHVMLVLRSGGAWVFPASDSKDARDGATAIRSFMGIATGPA